MKTIFKKENLMPAIVLGAICLVVAALMGAVNIVTGPIIQKAEEQKIYDSLREVLDGEFEPAKLPAEAPSTVTALYQVTDGGELIGHVVTLEKQGYASKILLTIGIDAEGKTTKVVITSQQETHGKDISPLLSGLSSVGSDEVMNVDNVANATKTSEYIKAAVADAFKVVGFDSGSSDEGDGDDDKNEESLPKTDEEIKNIAGDMVEGVTLSDISLEDAPEALKRAYSAGEDGYFLYIVVPGDYVPVATEAMVQLDVDCKIVKVNLLSWVVGHGVEPDNFADGFTGADKNTAGDVDLVTGATGTSSDFRDAVEDSLVYFAENHSNEETLPRTEDEIKAIADDMVEGDISLTNMSLENAPAALKRVYDAGDNGYFFYIVVPGAYVPVATEAVVHLDNSGEIVKVNLLSWVVGHGVSAGNFADGFAGANKDTAGDVELVTEATGTSSDFRDAVEESLVYFVENYDVKEELPKTDDEIKAIAAEMAGKELDLSDFAISNAPDTLKRVYSAGEDGYFLYIVVPGDYVPVATEAVVHLSTDCDILKVNLLSWIVGHGVEPGDFADGFSGTNKNTVGDVDLVTEATGTSRDFRDAVEAAIITVSDGDEAKENILIKKIQVLVPNAKSFEKIDIPENATKTLKALYKVVGFDGYVAYVITSTKYVDVETEALVYINSKGEVGNIELITWTVGHGVEPGNFAASLIGKNANDLADVELVSSATVTAGNLRDAVVDAIHCLPENNTPIIVGVATVIVSIIAIASIIIIKRRKRA